MLSSSLLPQIELGDSLPEVSCIFVQPLLPTARAQLNVIGKLFARVKLENVNFIIT